MGDDLKISQRAAELARGQELAEAIASALGTSLRTIAMETDAENPIGWRADLGGDCLDMIHALAARTLDRALNGEPRS